MSIKEIPIQSRRIKKSIQELSAAYLPLIEELTEAFKDRSLDFVIGNAKRMAIALLGMILIVSMVHPSLSVPSPFSTQLTHAPLAPLQKRNSSQEVFGFAPYWTLDKMQSVDFNVLTTLAYFSVPVGSDGNLDTTDPGYASFESQTATDLFTKAHQAGTRVVLTITQMDNTTIEELLANPQAQQTAIQQTVSLIKARGIDGVNIDFEYTGDPGQATRDAFSSFIAQLSSQMHKEVPSSYITVSVYATAVKNPGLDDISSLSKSTDGIFMMAYDFATGTSDTAMPTAPLYGYKAGKYWYDVSTAVSDFLTVMPSQKLILGVPWYGYNYAVSTPQVNTATYPTYSWYGYAITQTYSDIVSEDPTEQTGWDPYGEVSWKAYYIPSSGTWRMVFYENARSLGIKYTFAKNNNLGGIGIWALGFEDGSQDLWNQLEASFGTKIADAAVTGKPIQSTQ